MTQTKYSTIEESVHDHNGYKIRFRFRKGSGAKSDIFKVIEGRWFNLRTDQWNFQESGILITRAMNYINNFSERLEDRLMKQIIKHNSSPHRKHINYE
jgi:hypothetical protein